MFRAYPQVLAIADHTLQIATVLQASRGASAS